MRLQTNLASRGTIQLISGSGQPLTMTAQETNYFAHKIYLEELKSYD